jgi:serine phosphatase RsbU (regulator of sigma subunit)
VLREARSATANETAELLLNRVSGWAGPRAQDDITLIVVDVA